jgi:outer membrane protein assembly factor BamD
MSRNRSLNWPKIGLLLLCLGAASCASSEVEPQTAQAYAENAKKAYDEALDAYLDRDWELATQLMEAVKRDYGYSRYARLAQLRMADIEFRQQKYAEAVGEYEGFVHDYPNDPEVRYARYRILLAQFSESSESILLPPLEERDLVSVRDAYKSLRSFIGDYPEDEHRRDLDYMLDVVTGVLARHELYVARFYLIQDEFEATVARAEYVLDNFAGSGLAPEAIVLLGETYMKMKQRDKARAAFQLVLKSYPDSAFTVVAQNFLGQLDPTTAKTSAAN